MAADEEPVGEEAVGCNLEQGAGAWELLDEDPRWLTWLTPGYGAAMAALVTSIALAPSDGWVAQHRLAIVIAAFVVGLGVSTAWHRGHPFLTIDDHCRNVVGQRELKGWRGAVALVAGLTAWFGFCLAGSWAIAARTGGHTPIDEEEAFAMPPWLLPFALALLLLGTIGVVLAVLLLAPKVEWSDPAFREPPLIAKVAFVGAIYAAPILVAVVATESAQRGAPLLITVVCTPLCLWTIHVAGGGGSEADEAEVSAGWEQDERDLSADRLVARAEQSDGAGASEPGPGIV